MVLRKQSKVELLNIGLSRLTRVTFNSPFANRSFLAPIPQEPMPSLRHDLWVNRFRRAASVCLFFCFSYCSIPIRELLDT